MKITNKIFLLLCVVAYSCSSIVKTDILTNLGLDSKIKNKVFDWQDSHSPQGEGYNLEIYSLKTIRDVDIKTEYPLNKENQRNWKVVTWKKGQIDNKDIYELLFNYRIVDGNAKNEIVNLKKILNDNNGYISYYYKDIDGYIYAVDFYFLDIKQKRLYRCSVIT